MTPEFALWADGEAVASALADRLLSLRVTDEAGLQADALELTLDNRDDRIAPPRRGAELVLALGWAGDLTEMGAFVVTGLRGSGPDRRLSIRARAAAFDGPIRTPRTRDWRGQSFGAIARAIAAERGLTARVAPAFDTPVFPVIEQDRESDLNLLTRLAGDAGALATIKGGALVVTRAGSGETADGRKLPPVRVSAGELTGWSWSLEDRDAHKAVTAHWSDRAGAARREVRVGASEGDAFEMRRVFASAAEARRAAEAKLAALQRGAGRLEIACARFAPALTADAQIETAGLDQSADGNWRAVTVTHELSGAGLTTRAELEKAEES